jgi:hypothetical protein
LFFAPFAVLMLLDRESGKKGKKVEVLYISPLWAFHAFVLSYGNYYFVYKRKKVRRKLPPMA